MFSALNLINAPNRPLNMLTPESLMRLYRDYPEWDVYDYTGGSLGSLPQSLALTAHMAPRHIHILLGRYHCMP